MKGICAATLAFLIACAAPAGAWAWSETTVLQQRIDTEEVLLPPPPSGPSTPVPFCAPSAPICP